MKNYVTDDISDFDLVKYVLRKCNKNIPVVCKQEMFTEKKWV